MSLITLITEPFRTSAFGLLMLTILSLWFYRNAWIWGALLGLSLVMAFVSKTIELEVLVPLVLLLGAHLVLHFEFRGVVRYLALTVATIISFGLLFHLFPGFHNWLLGKDISLTSDATPFDYYWNYDKPFIGLFTLALNLPLIRSIDRLKVVLKKAIPLSLLTGIILLALSYAFGFIHFELKLTTLFLLFPLSNLFLVVIPEEAFFRGFLQREIQNLIPHRAAPWISILIVSTAFAFAHIFFVINIPLLVLAFVASFFYGMTYYFSEAIEGSILAHYLLNMVHFFFFTYPAIK